MRLFKILVVPALVGAALTATPTPMSAADCTSTGGTTICSQGDVRGSNSGSGPSGSSGPYVPYPCDYDWTDCNDAWGWEIDVNLDPDIGRPGSPMSGPTGPPGRPISGSRLTSISQPQASLQSVQS